MDLLMSLYFSTSPISEVKYYICSVYYKNFYSIIYLLYEKICFIICAYFQHFEHN